MVKDDLVTKIWDLKSSHEEADTHVILHNIYSAANDDVERFAIFGNDTQYRSHCVYQACSTHVSKLPKLWVQSALDSYLIL